MNLVENKYCQVRRIRNDSSLSCRCGRTPTYRYDYRFWQGDVYQWTYSICQECMQNELAKMIVGIDSIFKRLPNLPTEQWKEPVDRFWGAQHRSSRLLYE